MSRVKLLVAILILLLMKPMLSLADTGKGRLIVEQDLFQVAKVASERRQPVLVLFAADDCEFCERLEAEHLAPMSINDEYLGKVIIRKVLIDSYRSTRDFNGTVVSGDRLAKKYGVRVTPTIIVFNESGEALGKKLIGYNGNQYYGWDLDKAIDGAREALN